MNAIWEIHKVRTPDQIFQDIKEMVVPVGIILFGADCELKKQVWSTILNELGDAVKAYDQLPPHVVTIMRAFDDRSIVAVKLNSIESYSHAICNDLVALMKKTQGIVVFKISFTITEDGSQSNVIVDEI